MKPLTGRQREVLAAFAKRQIDLGRPPTLRELGRDLGIRSTNGVMDHVHALVRKGCMQWGTAPPGNHARTAAERWQLTETGWTESGVQRPDPLANVQTFEDACAGGYQYGHGHDALENARLGWNMAMSSVRKALLNGRYER